MAIRTSLLALWISMVALSAVAFAQTQTNATFNRHTYASSQDVRTIYSGDFNNDGVPDLVETSSRVSDHFTIQLGNKDGSFQAPRSVFFPPPLPQGNNTAFLGDVNNDGKEDIVFAIAGTNRLNVFLGHGDGTFAAAKVVTIALPNSEHFGGMPLVGADFNRDGKVDLVTQSNNDTEGGLVLMNGDGTGGFGAPKQLLSISAATNSAFSTYAPGDFDADGKADLAVGRGSCSPSHCDIFVHILYGNGAGSFTDVISSFDAGDFNFQVADLNSDGRSDVVGSGLSGIVALYGQTNRTLTVKQIGAPAANGATFFGNLVADYNGDTRMDVGGYEFRSATNDEGLRIFLQNADGSFTEEPTPASFPAGQVIATNPVVGDFNIDTKPDLLLVGASSAGSSTQLIDEFVNTTSGGDFGGCSYLAAGQGIHICSPGSSATSTVSFSASANSFQPLRKIELWIDGTKAAEQFHTWDNRAWFRFSKTLAAGTHTATFFAANPDNTLQKKTMTFTVGGGGCATPASSTGTVICSPTNGSTVSNPVNASAKGGSSVKNMEIWVDGTKRATSTTNSISATLTLSTGTHKMTVFSKNGSTVLSSAVSTFTVK